MAQPANITTSDPGAAMEFLGAVAYHLHVMRPLLPTYLHLVVSAIFPIVTAAHAALSRPSSAAKPKRKPRHTNADADADDEASEELSANVESLTPADALTFPLLAGCTLATLYFTLKWLEDPAWLNWFLGLYFSQIGLFFCFKFLRDGLGLLLSVCFPTVYSGGGRVWTVDTARRLYVADGGSSSNNPTSTTSSPLPGVLRHVPLPGRVESALWTLRNALYAKARFELHVKAIVELKTPVTLLDVISLLVTAVAVYIHTFVTRPWPLTNLLGFAFSYGSLQYISPSTAWTSTLILSALFAYDVYFVFYTPMMVTVATKLDVPIKLLFPRPNQCLRPLIDVGEEYEEYLRCLAKKRAMAMLGLGDIVVPGIVIAFALRFDLYLFYLRKGAAERAGTEGERQKPTYANARGSWGERLHTSRSLLPASLRAKSFPKPYFYSTLVGYVLGMVCTVVVMQVWAHAQPALLYLVPGVLGGFWGCALVRGDLQTLWQYNESPPEAKKDDANEKGKETSVEGGAPKQIEAAKDSTKPVGKGNGNDDGASKPKPAKPTDKKLISFSITLPETPESDRPLAHSGQNSQAGDTEVNAEPSGEGVPETAEQAFNAVVEQAKLDAADSAVSTARTTRSVDREASGEPMHKRSRRQ